MKICNNSGHQILKKNPSDVHLLISMIDGGGGGGGV